RLWNAGPETLGKAVATSLPDLAPSVTPGGDDFLSHHGRIFQVTTTPLGDGDRGGMLVTLHDVTESRQSEEAMRRRASSAEAHRDLMWRESLDLMMIGVVDGGLVQVNPAWQRLLGWTEAELLSRPLVEFIEPVDIDATVSLDGELRAGRPVHNFVNRLRATDGDYRIVQWNIRALPDSGLVFGIGRDITELRRMEQNISTAQRLEAVGRLAGGIAHDLNNTMTPVLCNASLLLEDPMPDSSLVMVREIADAAGRAATLTRHLLMFARRQSQTPAPTDLNAVIRNLETLLRRSLPENIELTLDLAGHLASFPGDTAGIELAITNLVSNAREAMPAGGQLTISTRSTGDRICLTVADTGEGMDEATRRRAFEPFFTTRPGGTGLGLPAVWGIAQQHGAGVEIETAPGRGARFDLVFRTTPGPHHMADADHPTRSTDDDDDDDARGTEHVLMVEDDELVLLATSRGLERLGYRVTGMRTGADALQWQTDTRPDVVVADIVLPDMLGTALCDALDERWPGVRKLYVSGYDASDSTRRAVVSLTPPIQKPFTAVRLARAIRHALASDTSSRAAAQYRL
ncbi:MAG: ATP-binding protein, partial [Planctomycetota bacterium]